MARRIQGKDGAAAPAQIGFDITADTENDLSQPTRFITVDTDETTVTGLLEGMADDATVHVTHPMKAGAIYPYAFKKVTAISGGNVKGYA